MSPPLLLLSLLWHTFTFFEFNPSAKAYITILSSSTTNPILLPRSHVLLVSSKDYTLWIILNTITILLIITRHKITSTLHCTGFGYYLTCFRQSPTFSRVKNVALYESDFMRYMNKCDKLIFFKTIFSLYSYLHPNFYFSLVFPLK